MRLSSLAVAALAALVSACTARDQLRALATNAAACESDGDCCVVVDACSASAYVVAADDFDRAASLADEASQPGPLTACSRCIAPAVEVLCVEGACTGVVADGVNAADALGPHCGSVGALGAVAGDGGVDVDDEDGVRVLGCGAGE